jgi:glycosyltransferase involved in cell wall biosynthesis
MPETHEPTNSFSVSSCLGVIMPVFNEVANVDSVLARILAQPGTAQVVVVDDHSDDATWFHLTAWPARDSRVRILRHQSNRGKGAAIRTALEAVSAPVVVIHDADLEYDPADHERMLQPILHGDSDVVYGSRFMNQGRVTAGYHRLVNWSLTTLANLATGLRLTDLHTCLKMFPTPLLKSVPLEQERFGFCPEITAKLARVPGLRLVEVPVSYHRRKRSEGKKIGIADGLRTIYCIFKYCRGPPIAVGWASNWKLTD